VRGGAQHVKLCWAWCRRRARRAVPLRGRNAYEWRGPRHSYSGSTPLSIRNDPDFRVPLEGVLLPNGSTY